MNANLIKGAGAAGGLAVAGVISFPMFILGACGLMLAGSLCTVLGSVSSNTKEATVELNNDGFKGSFKK